MKKTFIVIIVVSMFLITSCSKDKSTNSEVQNLSGTWETYQTENGGPEQNSGLCVIIHEDNILTVNTDSELVFELTISGTSIEGSFIEGNGVDFTTINGTINSSYEEMSGNWSSTTGDSGTWRMVKISDSTTLPDQGWNSLKVYGLNEGAYEIWVGNQSYLNEPSYWDIYQSISDYNFLKKGESITGGITNIIGRFKYYVVAVPEETIIDAIEFDEITYLNSSSNWDWGNLTANEGNIYGVPDGAGATIGLSSGSSGGIYNGYLIFINSNYTLPPISSDYQVWGGSDYIGGSDGYHPEDHNYTFIGESESTDTFQGTFEYYIIVVNENAFSLVDAIQGNNGFYYGTNTTGNTGNYQNISGEPDGKSALVGLHENGDFWGGYLLIHPSDSPSELTIYIGN